LTAVLFPLQGCKVFSKDPKDTYNRVDRIIKNAMLFFEEIWFEAGMHETTYGNTHSFEISTPYTGKEEYLRRRTSYLQAGSEKHIHTLRIRSEAIKDAKWFSVASSPARSYFLSFEGELEIIFENFSKKELEFIKFIYPKYDSRKATKYVLDQISSVVPRLKLDQELRRIVKKWDIGAISRNTILREAANAILLSRASKAPPVLDELHKDVMSSINLLQKDLQEVSYQIETLSKVMEIGVRDFGGLTIEKILELRNEPSIEAFRKVIGDISSNMIGCSKEEIDIKISQLINKELIDDLQNIVPAGKWRVYLSAVGDLLFSLPLPPPFNLPLQLIGLGKTVLGTIQSINEFDRWNKSFGCFWMKLSMLDDDAE